MTLVALKKGKDHQNQMAQISICAKLNSKLQVRQFCDWLRRENANKAFIVSYYPHNLDNKVKVTKIYQFIKVLSMMYLCQFGQNLAIG